MTILALHGLFPTHSGDVTQLVLSRYCVLSLCVLVASHVIITSVYYKGGAIRCFCPAYGPQEHCETWKAECMSSTSKAYKHDLNAGSFNEDEASEMTTHRYYNFVILILLLQAALFYCPSVVWRELSRRVGILPDELSLAAAEARRTKDVDDREGAVQDLATHIQKFCIRQIRKRHWSYAFRWFHGSKLCIANVFAKICYAGNVIGQFYMLDLFLGMPFHLLGWQIIDRQTVAVDIAKSFLLKFGFSIEDLGEGVIGIVSNSSVFQYEQNVTVTSIEFTTEIICVVPQRISNTVRTTSIDCRLVLNPLNELIFSYIWFLMFFAATVSMTSLAIALFQMFTFPCRRMQVRERLQDAGILDRNDPEDTDSLWAVKAFEKHFLQQDGMFLLAYVESGGGDVLADEVLVHLWKFFEESDLQDITKAVEWSEQLNVKVDEIPDRETLRCSGGESNDLSATVFIPMTANDNDHQLYRVDIPPAYDDLKAADV